jgi:hypothetical protein
VRLEASFEAATSRQLKAILTRVDKAGTRALDYLTQWVDGTWTPEGIDGSHIDWLIDWLEIQEEHEKKLGR